jgi:hypothetical protein
MARIPGSTVKARPPKAKAHVRPRSRPAKRGTTAKAVGDARRTDDFRPGDLLPLSVKRPPGQAVAFIHRFERSLSHDPKVLAEREAFQTSSYLNFFRANPGLFHLDMRGPHQHLLLGRPAPTVLITGDPHLGNFGTMKGPGKHIVWAMNDFDQAGRDTPEIDLKRLAVSAVLTAQARGMSEHQQKKLVERIAHAYARALEKDKPAYLTADRAHGPVKHVIEQAEKLTRHEHLARWTQGDRFTGSEHLEPVPAALRAEIVRGVEAYGATLAPQAVDVKLPLQILDVARRVDAGGSTLGLERYYVLVRGAEGKLHHILEMKTLPPTGVGATGRELAEADGRTVAGYADELLDFRSPLTGSAKVHGTWMLVRELEPEKSRIDPLTVEPHQLDELGEAAATVLAHAHGRREALREWIRSDQKQLAHELTRFALGYAEQVKADFMALVHSARR